MTHTSFNILIHHFQGYLRHKGVITYVLVDTGYLCSSSARILTVIRKRKFLHSVNTREVCNRYKLNTTSTNFFSTKIFYELTKEINLRIAPSWLHIHSHGSNESPPPPPSMLTSKSVFSTREWSFVLVVLYERCLLFPTKCDFFYARFLEPAQKQEKNKIPAPLPKLLARWTRKY